MSKIPFSLTPEEYCELASEALGERNIEKSVGYFRKALKADPAFAPASLGLAKIYGELLGAYPVACLVLYEALYKKPDEATEQSIFLELALINAKMGKDDVAEYYMRFDEDFDFFTEEEEDEEESDPRFRLVYSKDSDCYEEDLREAYAMVKDGKLDEAEENLKNIDPQSDVADAANNLRLVVHMLKSDTDGVIDAAKDMLNNSENLSIRCTLATAYMMEDKQKEAEEVLRGILERNYEKTEEIFILLPLLVNMEEHAQIIKYASKLIETLPFQANIMIWLSQALYNAGQIGEAERVMRSVRNVFGDLTPAESFLQIYAARPDSVEYQLTLPRQERIDRYGRILESLKLSDTALGVLLEADEEYRRLLIWAFDDNFEKVVYSVIDRLDAMFNPAVAEFYRAQLIRGDLDFDIMSRLIFTLLTKGEKGELIVDLVAQDRYKQITAALPDAFPVLPRVFQSAIIYSFCDILFTDEEPNFYLFRLREAVEKFVRPSSDGRPKYLRPKGERVGRFRSMRTLVGVLLAKVYEQDDDPIEDAITRYGLNPRTFEKYYKIVFGEDNE